MTEERRPGGGPDRATRLLVRLSAALPGGGDRWREALEAAAVAVEEGTVTRRAVEEALLQSYLFLGFPAALTALAAWRDRVGGEGSDPDPLARPGSLRGWRERGEAVCRSVYGDSYGSLRRNVGRLHPALDRWMVEEGYGKVLGRPGLDLSTRELCVVALLAAEGWGPQLRSHLRGALNVGASPGAVEMALEAGLRGATDPGTVESARRAWRRVRAK